RVHLPNPQRLCAFEPHFKKLMPGHFTGPIIPLIPSHLRGRDERSAGGGRGMGCRPPPPPAVPSPAGVNLHPGSGSVRAALAGSAGRGVPAALAGATRQGAGLQSRQPGNEFGRGKTRSHGEAPASVTCGTTPLRGSEPRRPHLDCGTEWSLTSPDGPADASACPFYAA